MSKTTRPGLGTPTSTARAIIFASLLLVVVDLGFVAHGAWKREDVFNAVKRTLRPTPPADVNALRAALQPWTVEELGFPASEADESPIARFVFDRASMLMLDAKFEPETGHLRDLVLTYWLSEPVSIDTGDGLVYALDMKYREVLILALAVLAAAIGWWLAYWSLDRRIRLTLVILWAVLLLPVGIVLLMLSANYYLF